MTDADVVVVGAGIVGLATARELLLRAPGRSVVVLDKEDGPARHQSGRNSGVVHAGVYYPPSSAKARMVLAGRRRLVDHCTERGLPLEVCGKVVVATRHDELAALGELERRCAANGVATERVGPSGLADLEPHVRGLAALHVPSSAITDFGAVARSFARDVVALGGTVRFDSEVRRVERAADTFRVVLTRGGEVTATRLVNCAGLHSDRIARAARCEVPVSILPFRGEYLELRAERRGLVRNLVYPVPDPRWPFLGVHLTRALDGSVHVGPNAVLAWGREHYGGRPRVRDVATTLATPGLWALARRYWWTGTQEWVRARVRALSLAGVRRLLPDVVPDDLVAGGSGLRAQAVRRDGTLVDDFAFARSDGAVHVLNAPSPAATASLAIAEHVADRVAALR